MPSISSDLRDIYFCHNKFRSNSPRSNDKFDTNKNLIKIDPNTIEENNIGSHIEACSLYTSFIEGINNVTTLGDREEKEDNPSSSCNKFCAIY
ncbi:MAG: hypothetical protein RCG15_01010 [Candidatus Rickettsia vulgarisii]